MNERQLEFREKLADLCHRQWSGWMEYLFSKCHEEVVPEYPSKKTGALVIPGWAVERWKRQMETDYSDLSKEEMDSDRTKADKFIALLLQRDLPDSCDKCPMSDYKCFTTGSKDHWAYVERGSPRCLEYRELHFSQ